MKNPKFSIVTAAFNSASTIRRCLDASINQNYQEFEHIIVDGISKDGTVDILAGYSSRDSRIKYISEKDTGIYDALNKGIKMSSGEYILIIGSDDWLEDGALLKVDRFLTEHTDTSILAGSIIKHYNNKTFTVIINLKIIANRYQIPVNHIATFIRRDVYDTTGLYSTAYKIASDLEFFLRVDRNKFPIVPFNEIITHFTCGGTSSGVYNLPRLNNELLAIRIKYLSKTISFLLYLYEQGFSYMRIYKRKWLKI